MALFQSVGGRYRFGAAWRHLLTTGSSADTDCLKQLLAKRYQGKVTLYHKGRSALAAGIKLATDGSGEVGITALTCYSVVQAVRTAGCQPVYIDIAKDNVQFELAELKKTLATHPHMKAVVIQNTLGIPCQIGPIERLAHQRGLTVIEDLAHCTGAHYADGREVGTVGDITMLSFGKDKSIDTVNGGALIVRRAELGTVANPSYLPRFTDQLRDRLYPLLSWHARSFYGVGLGKLLLAAMYRLHWATRSADGPVNTDEGLPHWQAHRALQEFAALPNTIALRRQLEKEAVRLLPKNMLLGASQSGAVPIRIPLRVVHRSRILTALKAAGFYVEDVWYDIPVSPIRFYKKARFDEKSHPQAVALSRQIINFPTHQGVRPADIMAMAAIIKREDT